MTTIAQDEQELRAFKAFAAICPLGLRASQATKQKPPKPDILCPADPNGQPIEFELVSANDKDMERRHDDSFILEDALHKELIDALSSNADYTLSSWSGLTALIVLDETKSKRQRLADIPRAIELLLDIGPNTGRYPIRGERAIREVCIQVNEYADWEKEKPSLITHRAGYFEVPVVSRIEQKLDKASDYERHHPFHLLCHARTTAITERWLPDLVELLVTHPNSGIFDRIWVFAEGNEAVPFDSAQHLSR